MLSILLKLEESKRISKTIKVIYTKTLEKHL